MNSSNFFSALRSDLFQSKAIINQSQSIWSAWHLHPYSFDSYWLGFVFWNFNDFQKVLAHASNVNWRRLSYSSQLEMIHCTPHAFDFSDWQSKLCHLSNGFRGFFHSFVNECWSSVWETLVTAAPDITWSIQARATLARGAGEDCSSLSRAGDWLADSLRHFTPKAVFPGRHLFFFYTAPECWMGNFTGPIGPTSLPWSKLCLFWSLCSTNT